MTDGYRWHPIGGHLALDLCNTIAWRLDAARTVDRLHDTGDLGDWFAAATGQAAPTGLDDRLLDQVRGLRAATIGVLDAHLDRRPAADRDLRAVHDAWRAALAAAPPPTRLPFVERIEPATPDLLLAHLALAVGELLHRPDLSPLRRCDGDGCGWLFLDTTRNHSRRWCDPLDCGNRARVRAYARRHRQ